MPIQFLIVTLFLFLASPMGEAPAAELFMGDTVAGVRQARDWQHAGDIALAKGDLEIAYTFYQKVAEVFPRTPHGRMAQLQMAMLTDKLRQAQESPAEESWETWGKEIKEFFTWP